MTIHNVRSDYHRNGVGGRGFYVVAFDDPENGPMVATVFADTDPETGLLSLDWSDGCLVAVFQRERLAEGVIAFGHNSWRGDHYAAALLGHLRRKAKIVDEWHDCAYVARMTWGYSAPWKDWDADFVEAVAHG